MTRLQSENESSSSSAASPISCTHSQLKAPSPSSSSILLIYPAGTETCSLNFNWESMLVYKGRCFVSCFSCETQGVKKKKSRHRFLLKLKEHVCWLIDFITLYYQNKISLKQPSFQNTATVSKNIYLFSPTMKL